MFRLGLAQYGHPADGDVIAMADEVMAKACAAGVNLIVFPESFMTPFEMNPVEFAEAAQPVDGEFCQAMNALAARHGIWTVYTMNEANSEGGAPFNTAIVVDDAGVVRGSYRKVHLFDTDFVRESDKISHGSRLFDPIQTPFAKLGVGICYDLRFPEPARAAALAGCDLLVYPSAWVDGPSKVFQWKTLLAARAIENEMFVAGVSRPDRAFGSQKRDYAGHSCVFGPMGEEVAAAGGADQLLVADIDLSAIERTRAAMPVLEHRRTELY